jgi:hypothetical protein
VSTIAKWALIAFALWWIIKDPSSAGAAVQHLAGFATTAATSFAHFVSATLTAFACWPTGLKPQSVPHLNASTNVRHLSRSGRTTPNWSSVRGPYASVRLPGGFRLGHKV